MCHEKNTTKSIIFLKNRVTPLAQCCHLLYGCAVNEENLRSTGLRCEFRIIVCFCAQFIVLKVTLTVLQRCGIQGYTWCYMNEVGSQRTASKMELFEHDESSQENKKCFLWPTVVFP